MQSRRLMHVATQTQQDEGLTRTRNSEIADVILARAHAIAPVAVRHATNLQEVANRLVEA